MKILFPLASLLLLVLYGSVGYFSPGYDDEFGNIGQVEQHGYGIVALMQTVDVHPPGQYFANWLLFSALGDWHGVRLAISLLAAASLIYAIYHVRARQGEAQAWLAWGLLGLNPAILMWCTGVRWYAFFVPVLVWLSITPKTGGWGYWGKYFAGMLVLAYFGYAAFIMALPLLLLYWMESREAIRERVRKIAILGAVAFAVYLPQMLVFLNVHYHNREQQVSSLAKSAAGFVIAQFGNQGVFPLSAPGLISMLGTALLAGVVIRHGWRQDLRAGYFLPYVAASVLNIVSGLAGKFRNLVVVSPWQALWLASHALLWRKSLWFKAGFFMVLAGNAAGVVNVATHRDTTKNSWNTPTAQIAALVEAEHRACNGDVLIMTYDITVTHVLESRGYKVLGPMTHKLSLRQLTASGYPCLLVFQTYAGGVGADDYRAFNKQVDALAPYKLDATNHSRDPYFSWKRKLDPRYPEYQFTLARYRNVAQQALLPQD